MKQSELANPQGQTQIEGCCQSLGLEKTGSDYITGVGVSFGGNENVLNLIEMVVIPHNAAALLT